MNKVQRRLGGWSLLLALGATAGVAWGSTSLTEAQQRDVKHLVAQTLEEQPKLVVDALIRYRAQKLKHVQTQVQQTIRTQANDLFHAPASGWYGAKHPDVIIAEFMDYRCGHCRHMGPVLEALTKKDASVRVVVKQLPIFQGASEVAARAALVAVAEGRFLPLHRALMAAPMPLDAKKINALAQHEGLQDLKARMASANVSDRLARNMALAKQLHIMGTPVLVVADPQGHHAEVIVGEADAQRLHEAVAKVRHHAGR